MRTRLATFIETRELRIVVIADAANVSRRYIYQLRHGAHEPTLGVMVRIARACSILLDRRVRVAELFDLGDDEPMDETP